jgi:hypothetical protein
MFGHIYLDTSAKYRQVEMFNEFLISDVKIHQISVLK